MFVELQIADGSLIPGMDIEFFDQIENRKKLCQLKSGPNTINSEDVKPLMRKFTNTIQLARTNKALKNVNNTDFIVGVLYGDSSELSMHYKEIDKLEKSKIDIISFRQYKEQFLPFVLAALALLFLELLLRFTILKKFP